MTDRDHFAAAALTGLLAQGDDGSFSEESYARAAYRWADAMLRERGKTSVGVSEMDSESDRKSVAAHGACARSCSQPFDSAPTTQSAPPRVKTDGFSSGSSGGTINRSAERESPRRECGESSLRDVPQLDNSRAAGGPEPSFTSGGVDRPVAYAKTNAERVGLDTKTGTTPPRNGAVDDESDRSQPIKDDVSDRSKPISDERLAALEELSALDQELELEHGITGNPMIKAQRSNESI